MKHWGRWFTLILVGGGIAAGVFYGLQPRPAMVEAVAVARGSLRVSIIEEGRTRVRDRYIISAPVGGHLRRTDLKVGDPVGAGQQILWLDPLPSPVLDSRSRAEIQARIGAAEAAVETAREQAELAETELKFQETELARVRQLVSGGTIPREQLDQAETAEQKAAAALRSARFQVEVSRHELEASRAALRYSAAQENSSPAETVILRAPVAGRILKVIQENESVVIAAEPLLEMATRQRWRWKWRSFPPMLW